MVGECLLQSTDPCPAKPHIFSLQVQTGCHILKRANIGGACPEDRKSRKEAVRDRRKKWGHGIEKSNLGGTVGPMMEVLDFSSWWSTKTVTEILAS